MRWDPLRELLVLNELRHDSCRSGASAWIPAVDLFETCDGYVAIVELPGLSQSDFNLQVAGNILTLRGSRQAPAIEAQQYMRLERAHGAFERHFSFPDTINASGIQATFHDGVLTVTIPKAQQPEALRVTIGSS